MHYENLLLRLKPEILEAINNDMEKYPYLIEDIKKKLSSEISILDLKYGTALSLISYHYIAFREKPITAIDCFKQLYPISENSNLVEN